VPNKPDDRLTVFFAGPENRLLEHVLPAIAPSTDVYNPFLLYGPSGSGKSALVATIEQQWRLHYSHRAAVRSVRASDFAAHVAEAVAAQGLDDLRRKYRSAKLLIIEDLHHLKGNTTAQEELLHTLDAVLAAGGRVVGTARTSPALWQGILPALQGRWTAGLCLPVVLPGLAARVAIVQQVAAARGIVLSDQMVKTLARKWEIPAAELARGVLRFCQNAPEDVDTRNFKGVRHCAAQHLARQPITLRRVAQETARHFRVTLSAMRGGTRRRLVVVARKAAIFLARNLLQESFSKIGQFFGKRHHTTVLYEYHRSQEDMKTDFAFCRAIEELREKLTQPT
jgi:chromosomal replication initiator protein